MENCQFTSPIKKIIKDVRYYAPAKIIPGFFGFLAIIIYTRLLSPEEYGLYILAITTISIAASICFEWLNKSILRYFEEYKQAGQLTEFISTVVNSLMGITIAVLMLWYLGVNLLQNHLGPNLILLLNIGGLLILAEAGYTFILYIRQAAQESFKYATHSIINAVAKLVIAICFIYFFHIGPKGIIWGMIITAGGIFIWDILYLHRKWRLTLFYFSKGLLKKLFIYGFPLIGVSIASLVLVAVDRYMIGYFLAIDKVGIYSAGYALSNEIIQFPMVILLLAAYPIIMETFEKKGEKETSLLLSKLLSFCFIFLLPIVFGIAILSKNITSILLGSGFYESYLILPWIAIGVFCFGLTQYFYKPFELRKKTKDLFYLVVLAAISNIILNLFFIPKFGILGAAYSTLMSYVIYFFSTLILSRRIFLWSFPWKTIIKTFLSGMIMYLMLYLVMPFHSVNIGFLITDIFLGAICYFSILLLLKEKNIIRGFLYVLGNLKN